MKENSKKEAHEFENQLKELSLLKEKSKKNIEMNNTLNFEKNGNKLDYLNNETYDYENKKNNPFFFNERIIDQKLLEKHRKLELDYAKIQATTKIDTYDELMQAFIEIEEKNFQSFKFINELCIQMENLETSINVLKSIFNFRGKKRIRKK